MEWIKAEEKLPEFNVPVIACLVSGYDKSLYMMPMARIEDGEFWYWARYSWGDMLDINNYEADDEYFVRYWSPLPEKPKGD